MQELATPGVVKWYRVYAAFLAGIYIILVIGCAAGLFFSFQASSDFWREIDTPPFLLYGYVVFFGLMSLALAAVFVAAFIIPRKPWAWTYHIVLICLGLSSACFIPICVPLLIYWLRPETKAYFGKA